MGIVGHGSMEAVKQLPPSCATGYRFTGQGGHRPLPRRWDTRPYFAYLKPDLIFGITLAFALIKNEPTVGGLPPSK